MNLIIDYGNIETNEWEHICSIPMEMYANSFAKNYPGIPVPEFAVSNLCLENRSIKLPNNEEILITAYYSPSNESVSVRIANTETTLVDFGGIKSAKENYDPTLVFLTPKGLHLSVFVGKEVKR
ncbi:hypothetical protein [Teredinibacter turnerae]|uniref:hypothetical protein n=1 Tax=Teredinibacter turnerae TaxID=2426 RepID=UPI0003605B2A|nr:hypothetical protein [Teredinibacter turnerae]